MLKNSPVFTPAIPTDISANPIRSSRDWDAMRLACQQDAGKFHGDIAASNLHWYHAESGCWLTRCADGKWHGWDAGGGKATLEDSSWTPWDVALDESDAPFYRWFSGGLTNAAFNEVDRHVLSGHGDEVAFWYEGDRWDPAKNSGRGGPVEEDTLTRRELLVQSVFAAQALLNLGLSKGDRIALNMPNILAQIIWTEAAKRIGVIYTPVFGGFSDKTLSDRIENAGAKVVITADGAARNAETAGFKEAYTDPALDRYVSVQSALDILENMTLEAALQDRIIEQVRTGLSDEITVLRADVMREVGLALSGLRLAADQTAKLRADIADALSRSPNRVSHVVVVKHAHIVDLPWVDGRDVWEVDLIAQAESQILSKAGLNSREELDALDDGALVSALWASVAPTAVDAEFPLFIIYTSGSTGKPKGVVHVHGGYVSGLAHTIKVAFDATPGRDRMFVVADPGWITGQSYMITAALAGRIPSVITEGSPVFPNAGRFASIIERYGITAFKAGATFLKAVMTNPQNQADVERYDMSTLRVATFCAEPTSPTVQKFAMELITSQYINSYWATEHGGIVWTHPYGNCDQPLRVDAHTYPLPWVFGDVWLTDGDVDDAGRYAFRVAASEEKGEVIISRPYPYLARTLWGDADNVCSSGWCGDIERFSDQYFGRFRHPDGSPVFAYLQGDYARKYADGSFSLHGRSDDVINVSGHRMGTEEIEGAILKDKQFNPESAVGNCIVIGARHREKGLTPLAFIQPADGKVLSRDDERRLKELVREEKGVVAVPSDFITVSAFPETRSGKYMRRVLKSVVLGEDVGDISTLKNPECLPEISTAVAKWQSESDRAADQTIIEHTRTLKIEYVPVGLRQGTQIRIATITLSNPPVNALSERLLDELETVLTHIERRDDIGAVVIAGEGSSSFVAGADIRQLMEDVHSPAQARSLPSKAHAVANTIECLSKPVIAAVEGVALGGGCELALACHLRIGNARTAFAQPEINLYLPPGYGGTQRLPRVIVDAAKDSADGLGEAMAMLLSGRQIDGEKALEIGLLDQLATHGQSVLSTAQALARTAALTGEGLAMDSLIKRRQAVERWSVPGDLPAFGNTYLDDCIAAAEKAGRGPVARAIISLVLAGFAKGFTAGLQDEIDTFSKFVLDAENGGKKGIQLFLDKQSPALPSRPRTDLSSKAQLIEEKQILPIGSAFYPGFTPVPKFQLAHAVVKDAADGTYLHNDPIKAETEVIVPVETPGPNQTLLYMLTSEVNYNDCWAISGIPVSLFDEHDEDIHITGSGGAALVVSLGEALQKEGRLKIGQLVTVYSGVSDLLDPGAGDDPMFTDFHIQGYQGPKGSHQQFMLADGPQCFVPPTGLSIEDSGGYILTAGTAYRALFNALDIRGDDRVFVEGAASGTGAWSVELSKAAGAFPTGLVSSDERVEKLAKKGCAAVNRKRDSVKDCFTRIPSDPAKWADWSAAGEGFLDEVRRVNDGKLCTHAVSHAGETCFPRSFQALEKGGVLTYFGASSGYHMTFMGKPGRASPAQMLNRAAARPGEAVLIFYGTGTRERDNEALEAIEAGRALSLRMAIVTDTGSERDFVLSLGFGDAIAGAVSLEEIHRRDPDFDWPDTMRPLPDPARETEAFKDAVRLMNANTLKPLGKAVGKLLRSADNPRGQPDIIVERAGVDTLFVSTMLVKPYTGRVVYSADMEARRYSFYAPQVWMRQRRILMPTAAIVGTHLCSAAEVIRLNRMIEAGAVQVPETFLGDWDTLPEMHQAMWENRLPEMTGGLSNAVANHAVPIPDLKTVDELWAAWSAEEGS
jgi:acrylyl-CoA reductase (NADPH)/3-hydroxypropionyl-CoA dehydratase/3-hydroxypropionyl-CoA synthetase